MEEQFYLKFANIPGVLEGMDNPSFKSEIEKLAEFLKPTQVNNNFASLVKKDFNGRKWLFKSVDKWMKNSANNEKMLWIAGERGVGKSAFMANLTLTRPEMVIATQFVEWDKPFYCKANSIIRNIAFQLAVRLPEYRKYLISLLDNSLYTHKEIHGRSKEYGKYLLSLSAGDKLDGRYSSELFGFLLSKPLKELFIGNHKKQIIIIDGVDEAGPTDNNPLINMISQNINRLPDWVKVIITSRHKSETYPALVGINQMNLEAESKANYEDIRDYLRIKLKNKLQKNPNVEETLQLVVNNSKGSFLYAELFCEILNLGNISLDVPEQIPQGLNGLLSDFFQQQFPNQDFYKETIEPKLGVIVAARETLHLETLKEIFKEEEAELNKLLMAFKPLLNVITDNKIEFIKPFHKSVIDWLTHQGYCGAYFVDKNIAIQRIEAILWNEFEQKGTLAPSEYSLKHLAFYLISLKQWGKLEKLLCSFSYIQAKAAAKMTFDLIDEFYQVLEVIPANQENIIKENQRQNRLEKYCNSIIACAKGELPIQQLEIPESISLTNDEQFNSKAEERRAHPVNSEVLHAFVGFLSKHADVLQSYAHELPNLAAQLAWNYATDGPVVEAVKSVINGISEPTLLRVRHSGQSLNPFPMLREIIIPVPNYTGPGHIITCDGQKVVSVSADTVIFQNIKTHRVLRFFTVKGESFFPSTLTPDAKRVISVSEINNAITLWDLETEKPLNTFFVPQKSINFAAISSDGKYGFHIIRKNIQIWDVEKGVKLRKLSGHKGLVTSISCSADFNIAVSSSEDLTGIIWDLKTGKALNILPINNYRLDHVNVLVFPNGKRAVSVGSNSCIVWDLKTGNPIIEDKSNPYSMRIAITADGKMALGTIKYSYNCILWELESGKSLKNYPMDQKSRCTAMALSPDGKIALIKPQKYGIESNPNIFYLWDIERNTLNTLPVHTEKINCLSVSPEGNRIVSASDDHKCVIWDAKTGKALKTLLGHKAKVTDVVFTPDSKKLIATSEYGTILIWDSVTGEELKKIDPAHTLAYKNKTIVTHDGKRAVSNMEEKCFVWDLVSGEQMVETLFSKKYKFRIEAISPDGKIGLSAEGMSVHAWCLESGELLKTLSTEKSYGVESVIFTPDGKKVIAGCLYSCIVWDLFTETEPVLFSGHKYSVTHVALTPDGKRLVTASHDNTCIVWDLISAKALLKLEGHTDIIEAIEISADGRFLVSVSRDKCCFVWDLDSGKKLSVLTFDSPLTSASITPHGLCIGSEDGNVFIMEYK